MPSGAVVTVVALSPKFLTPIDLSPVDPRGRIWRVDSDLVFRSDRFGVIRVPAGFVCDLNSMPRILWILSPPTDFPAAGAIHDWGYRGNLPRADADALYKEVLEALGAGPVRREARYYTLRLFGWGAYKG